MSVPEIALRWTDRQRGLGHTPRHYLEIVVEGRSLRAILGAEGFDLIEPFGWGGTEQDDKFASQLLLNSEPQWGDRYPLLVCPECADLDCGAITCGITRTGDSIVWSSFALENGIDLPVTEPFAAVGPLRFHELTYRQVFQRHLGGGAPNNSVQRSPTGHAPGWRR